MTVNSRFTDVTYITPTITAGQSYIMDLTLGNIFCWGVYVGSCAILQCPGACAGLDPNRTAKG